MPYLQCCCLQFVRQLFEALVGMVHVHLLDGIAAPCSARNAQGTCMDYRPGWMMLPSPGQPLSMTRPFVLQCTLRLNKAGHWTYHKILIG